jgi:hypothetical protein
MSNSNRLGYECKIADLPKYTIVRTRMGTYIHVGHGTVLALKSNLGPVDGHPHSTDLWAPHNWMIVTPDAVPSKGRHAATSDDPAGLDWYDSPKEQNEALAAATAAQHDEEVKVYNEYLQAHFGTRWTPGSPAILSFEDFTSQNS